MSLEKYRLVSDSNAEIDDAHLKSLCRWKNNNLSIMKITQKGKPKHYISDALQVFHKGSTKLVLRAMGRAISKAITVTEVLKRKLILHQVYEPLEEGLDKVESVRYVSCVDIMLSLDTEDIDIDDIGYQPPLFPARDDRIQSQHFDTTMSLKRP